MEPEALSLRPPPPHCGTPGPSQNRTPFALLHAGPALGPGDEGHTVLPHEDPTMSQGDGAVHENEECCL